MHPHLQATQLIPLRQANVGVEQPNPTAMALMLQMLKGSVATRSKASTLLTLEQAQRHLPENLLQWNRIERIEVRCPPPAKAAGAETDDQDRQQGSSEGSGCDKQRSPPPEATPCPPFSSSAQKTVAPAIE